jgi:CAAX protease family protein
VVVKLFWNAQERRLRLLWRLIGQLAIFVFLMTVLAIVSGILMGLLSPASLLGGIGLQTTSPDILLFSSVLALVCTLLSLWLAGRLLDRRPFAGFGFHVTRSWLRDLGFGLALGALLMTAIFLVEWAAGWVTLKGTFQTAVSDQSFVLAFANPLIVFICVGIYEEALSRGYLLCNLSEGLNYSFIGARAAIVIAWILSSAIFGVAHLGNPNSSLVSTINLVIAGLLLGLGYVLTGELAIPIGLHITWNLFQGSLFGFPVSGATFGNATVIAIAQGGPDVWTGGAFGPEAGLIGAIATVVGGLLILLWVRSCHGDAGERGRRLGFDKTLAHPPR